MGRRIRLTMGQFNEMTESLKWCEEKGFVGFVEWYRSELDFHARRRALPEGVASPFDEDDRR